jgi:hypothetical protein
MPITVGGTQITFNDATTQSTAAIINTTNVLNATAGASAGAVGTYMIARKPTSPSVGFGSTTAGSGLTPIAVMTGFTNAYAFGAGGAYSGGAAQSGTWRCMSISSNDISSGCGIATITGAALWLRIS